MRRNFRCKQRRINLVELLLDSNNVMNDSAPETGVQPVNPANYADPI